MEEKRNHRLHRLINLCNRDIILFMTNKNNKEKDPRTHAIIGAAMEVHREMGPGFLEAVCHECLEIEFQIRKIPYIFKPRLKLNYKIGHPWPIFFNSSCIIQVLIDL